MTHNELVGRAAKWLKGSARCSVVLTERLAMACVNERGAEMPDAIGWNDHSSILIECKTSVADLRADRRKHFRKTGGAGDVRYYLCARGVLKPDDIPAGWGLLEIRGKITKTIKRPDVRWACSIGLRRERYLLRAMIGAMPVGTPNPLADTPLFAGEK